VKRLCDADPRPGRFILIGCHPAWLRDHIGDRLIAGVVLHTGSSSLQLGERLRAHPIIALWT